MEISKKLQVLKSGHLDIINDYRLTLYFIKNYPDKNLTASYEFVTIDEMKNNQSIETFYFGNFFYDGRDEYSFFIRDKNSSTLQTVNYFPILNNTNSDPFLFSKLTNTVIDFGQKPGVFITKIRLL